VQATVGHHASDGFISISIFISVLVAGFYTYPQHTPITEWFSLSQTPAAFSRKSRLRQGMVSTAKEVENKRKRAGAPIREVNERVEDLKACFARL